MQLRPAHSDSEVSLLEEEQDRLAKYWAGEDSNQPRGWEQREELDYSEIATSLGLREDVVDLPNRPDRSSLRPTLRDFEQVDESLFVEEEEIVTMTTPSRQEEVELIRSRLPSLRSKLRTPLY